MQSLPARPLADPTAVVAGKQFRITLLTDGLLRLEWADDGAFEDRPSAFALNRALPVPDFRVIDGEGNLEIITDRLHLIYDRQPFSSHGLSIQIRGNVSNYHSVWRYGAAPDTLGGTARTLDNANGAIPLEPGVVSRNGFAVMDDSRSLVFPEDGWVAPRDGSRIDLYFFGFGHDYPAALAAFFQVSGQPPVLPRFALGNWWSRYHAYTADEYLRLMDRFSSSGIPLSVAVLDMDWHHVDVDPAYGSGWTGYSWNTDLFPDPPAFLAELHQRGLQVTLNVHPADGIRPFEDAYPDMVSALDRQPGDTISFDITDRNFLEAYFHVLHRGLEEQGVDFWWLDWQSGPYSRIAGIDPLWMLNHFHFLDSGRDGRRPLTFSRYAGPGSHRYPVGFSGDTHVTWESLAFQPYFTATASNIGYGWWSHDVGGHMFGYKDDELTARWVQLGVFSPILRLHSTASPFSTKEPWTFDAATERVMTEQLRLRHRLLPYLHTMNHRAHSGQPLVRPLYWLYPEAPEAYEVSNEFLFGDSLLVAPITSPRDPATRLGSVTAWLPDGEWVDIFTDLRYTGGRLLALHRDAASIPVLAPAGTVLPLDAAPVPGNGTANPQALEVLVVAGADGQFEMIEDDETEAALTTSIRWDQAAGTFTVGPARGNSGCVPDRRNWTFTLVGGSAQTGTASIDGAAAPVQVATESGRLRVTVTDVPTGAQLVIRLNKAPVPAGNDLPRRAFALLDRAQIAYDIKTRAYRTITGAHPASVRASHLQALDLSPALLSALSELLLAHPDA